MVLDVFQKRGNRLLGMEISPGKDRSGALRIENGAGQGPGSVLRCHMMVQTHQKPVVAPELVHGPAVVERPIYHIYPLVLQARRVVPVRKTDIFRPPAELLPGRPGARKTVRTVPVVQDRYFF